MTDEVKLRALIGEGIKSHEERKEAWILAGKPGERPTIMDSIADYLIANGVTFATDNHVGGKWIPVTERLPELGENGLMYFKDCETVVSGFLNGGEPGRATWWSSFTDGDWYTDCDSSPDYWMLTPEPPMRKGENAE